VNYKYAGKWRCCAIKQRSSRRRKKGKIFSYKNNYQASDINEAEIKNIMFAVKVLHLTFVVLLLSASGVYVT